MRPKIGIISSVANDRIRHYFSKTSTTVRGGPATWIIRTIENHSYPYFLVTGDKPAEVELLITPDGESGSIQSLPLISLTEPVEADIFIISTIGQEFDLNKVLDLTGLIALDVQGYVRTRKSKFLEIPREILLRIDIIKATESEYASFSSELRKILDVKLLIVTKGKRGFDMYQNGNVESISGNIVAATDTIGAGDTFLTAFVLKFYATRNALLSGQYAQDYVEKFLLTKTD